jgi:hypothetical protein
VVSGSGNIRLMSNAWFLFLLFFSDAMLIYVVIPYVRTGKGAFQSSARLSAEWCIIDRVISHAFRFSYRNILGKFSTSIPTIHFRGWDKGVSTFPWRHGEGSWPDDCKGFTRE